jgi:DNA-3-methyladenine glycosylase II
MPATRSSTHLAELATTASNQTMNDDPNKRTPSRKRKAESTLVKEKAKNASNRDNDRATAPMMISQRQVQIASASDTEDTKLVPAVLAFNFEAGKKHLIGVDPRFEGLFRKVECRPFEILEQVHPFRCEKVFF